MDEVNPGQRWMHYKNPLREYEISGIARDSENLEEKVIYRALYAGEFPFGQIWARPKSEFLGTVKVEGKEVNRFTRKVEN